MTKKKKIIIGAILLALIAIIVFFATRKAKIEYTTEKVERKTLIQTVSETGSIKSADEMELNFQNTGKISRITVKVGDRVSSSQILAELNYRDLSIREKDARASLDIARANLNKLVSGATTYEINVKQASVLKAQTEYESALKELEEVKKSVIQGSVQAETDAIISMETNISKAQISIDNVNTILSDDEAKYLLGARNTSLLNQTRQDYETSKYSITNTRSLISTAKATKNRNDIRKALNEAVNTLNKAFTTLLNCYQTLEYSITSSDFTQTELDAYKSTISGQETIISASLSSVQNSLSNLNDTELNDNGTTISGSQQITAAQSKVDSYYQSWQLVKAQLEELKAPARHQDTTLYEAQVRQAESSLESIHNQIENSIIRAPIDGVITRVEYKKGEQVSMTKPVIYMLSESKLEIQVDISESDITKIKNGDPVEISLDALSSEQKLYGRVYDIDPAETIIQDVTYYKTQIAFDIPDELNKEIKPGMTANVIIKTKEKEDVLMIPSRAIIDKNGDGQFVKILENEIPKEVSIKTGIYGDNGMVEIISGLQEGDRIITSSTESKK